MKYKHNITLTLLQVIPALYSHSYITDGKTKRIKIEVGCRRCIHSSKGALDKPSCDGCNKLTIPVPRLPDTTNTHTSILCAVFVHVIN